MNLHLCTCGKFQFHVATYTICGPGRSTYTCAGCGRDVPWCFGAGDDMPDHCDDCWSAAHPCDGGVSS